MSWFEKIIPAISTKYRKKSIPEGLWKKCDKCSNVLYGVDLEKQQHVCCHCTNHFAIAPRKRISYFLDSLDTCSEIADDIQAVDLLKFKDLKKYKDRISAAQKATGEKEAIIVIRGLLKGKEVVVAVFDFNFLGGSMSSGVGAKFVHGVNLSIQNKLPFICFSASGGARMQESLFSLMQMAKTSAALSKLNKSGGAYISVLTNPTMGGVSASFAMLGDIIIAEPNALIGFAGPRVIEQTVRQKLPEGFQRSEFLLKHGAIDMIVTRNDMRDTISSLLDKLSS